MVRAFLGTESSGFMSNECFGRCDNIYVVIMVKRVFH